MVAPVVRVPGRGWFVPRSGRAGSAIGSSATGFTLKDLWTKATSTSTGTLSASVPAGSRDLYRVNAGTTFTGGTKAQLTYGADPVAARPS
ncbi:hypothetical protein [Streptomyces sp. NBC_01244]|uniref:hypothetical protein n=1 Tax=Streptomyces sp. NBC_01244 TaxID=2903797 RepID=UPI002E0FBEF3|nr:hypothetical protein OG247_05430 [Streptomyces sp. NBC_01244]